MMAARPAVLLLTVLSISSMPAPVDKKTATSGDDVILPCNFSDIKAVDSVQWSRKDLDSDLLSFRPNQPGSLTMHLSYVNRVYLQDEQMKNGNISLVLKNVSVADSETYECRVKIDDDMKLICNITLGVSPPGKKDGGQGIEGNSSRSGPSSLNVVLPVAAVVFLLLYC